jgi:hypothetical protein
MNQFYTFAVMFVGISISSASEAYSEVGKRDL